MVLRHKKITILQVGPISYVGGVSVHMHRLVSLLDEDFDFIYIDESPKKLSKKNILNIRSIKDQFKIFIAINKSDLIHIHSGNWVLRIYFLILAITFRKKIIVTLHSLRLKGLKLSITNYLLRRTCRIIAVSEEIKKKLSNIISNKIIVLEAFLPPNIDNEPVLPPEIVNTINEHRNKSCLIAANAFRIRKLENGELYGLDQCIEVAENAKSDNYSLHIIFVIGTIKKEDKSYLEFFQKKIENKNIESHITIYPSSLSFIRLINEVDIVLRPTLTDGDALTIREALYMNKDVVASKVVKRPEFTTLYETANTYDLFSKIKELRRLKNNTDLTKFYNKKKNYKIMYTKLYTKCNN